MATFELWDARTNHAIGRYESKSLALHVVRNFLDRGDIVTVAALVLRQVDWAKPSITIASGANLVALARIGTGEEWTRSRRQRTEENTVIATDRTTGSSDVPDLPDLEAEKSSV